MVVIHVLSDHSVGLYGAVYIDLQWEKEDNHKNQGVAYRQQFVRLQEAITDGHQSLLRPFVEPVDAGAVDYGREFTATNTQGGADGWETKYNLWLGGKQRFRSWMSL